MKAFVRICAAAVIFVSGIAVAAEPTAFKFEKLAEGVYFGTPNLPGTNNDNVLVVVGDNDVLMVDGGAETATAKKLQADVATLTSRPIKRLVNTHFHFDHAGGNEAYAPDVQIITSAYTAERLKGNPYAGHTFQNFFGPSGAQTKALADLKTNVAAEADPSKKADMERRVRNMEEQMAALKTAKSRTANIVVKDKLVIPRAAGEIQVIALGRGHTGGDLMVYLPKERIVATGDYMQSGLGYMGDSYPEDWANNLEKIKALDVDIIVGGHGPYIKDKAKVDAYQGFLRDFAKQAATLKKQGVSAEDAAKRIDLSAYKADYPAAASGAPLPGVVRYYELLDGKDLP